MKRILILALVFILLAGTALPLRSVQAASPQQWPQYNQQAVDLLATLTTEEKVGQIFLVSFSGSNVGDDSPLAQMIDKLHIGGVVLRADRDNLVGPESTAATTQALIRVIQQLNWDAAQTNLDTNKKNKYLPLFVGISQEGDLYPYDQIQNGLTTLPSQMAIGAGWNAEDAKTIGTILGSELRALGVNLLFGPSLDVLDTVNAEGGELLGVRSFGGDPFWVGEMGKAYIQGLHTGSANKLAVIAKHFPGQGSSDRQPENEVATVRKSLEQLKQIELAPFFAVAAASTDTADQSPEGFLAANIRYQGFQGNIRATTKPISFDSAALTEILSLPQFEDWKNSGGIIISDNLANPAVRKFFDPLNTGFDARQVAKSALLAGNDILYLGDVVSSNDSDALTSITRIVNFFVQKYTEDNAFKLRVDEAVLKILQLKLKLYPDQNINLVVPGIQALASLGQQVDQVNKIAQQAVTLINPGAADLAAVLPDPPQWADRIVFISDLIPYQQCSTCSGQTLFPAEAVMKSVLRIYGPGAGEQIQANRLMSYSIGSLKLLLDRSEGTEAIQSDLNAANWIVFCFSESSGSAADATQFRRLFAERPDLVRNKKVIGMAFNAPYFMDSTDISKLSAFYGLFSKIPLTYDIAAKVLFQEISPTGYSPVSIPGSGYDLIQAVSPDPGQIIQLQVVAAEDSGEVVSTPSMGGSQPLLYKVGDTVPVSTGVIRDNNGHAVPDGTLVKFLVDAKSITGSLDQFEVQTVGGIAQITYVIPSIGSLQISASADPALISEILRLDITDAGGVITSFQPTVIPEETIEPTPTLMVTPTVLPLSVLRHKEGKLTAGDWFLCMLLILAGCLFFGWVAHAHLPRKWLSLLTVSIGAGGNVGYLLTAAALPGIKQLVETDSMLTSLLFTAAGMLLGLGIGYLVFRVRGKTPNAKS